MSKFKIEIEDTGNATANLVLLINKLIAYSDNEAGLSDLGFARLMSVFEDSSKHTDLGVRMQGD
jgi:hypothetical protein